MSLSRTSPFGPFRCALGRHLCRSVLAAKGWSGPKAPLRPVVGPVRTASFSHNKSPAGIRRVFNDMFDSMEHDMLAPWGMASRFPTIGFPYRGSRMFPLLSDRPAAGRSDFGMHLDLHETDTGFEMSVDLPGMTKEDIAVDVDDETGVLTVTGERKQDREEKSDDDGGERKYYFLERSYGKTTRSIRLPETADVARASAAYTDGVLKVTFPKLDTPNNPRRLQIPLSGAGGDGTQDVGKVSIKGGVPAGGEPEG